MTIIETRGVGKQLNLEAAGRLTAVMFLNHAGSFIQLMDRDGVAFATTGLMTEPVNEMLRRNKRGGDKRACD